MSYLVATAGRILLPERLESQALTVLEVELAARVGRFRGDVPAADLAELGRFAGAELRRDGDWLVIATDRGGDPQWSEQADAFYTGLARFVVDGEVQLRGQDGAQWLYRYSADGVAEEGVKPALAPPPPEPPARGTPTAGGASAAPPVAPPAPRPADPPADPPANPLTDQPAVPAPPPPSDLPAAGGTAGWPPPPGSPTTPPGFDPNDPFFADPAPAPRSPGRTAGMAVLLVVGVLLIVAVAMIAAGIA